MSRGACDHVAMVENGNSYAWLPDHQLHIVGTLAHVDGTIDSIATILRDLSRRGMLDVIYRVEGDTRHLIVENVKPIPPLVPRLVGDALNQLRSALEHTIYAEVELLQGRALTSAEGRRIEMPVATTSEDYERWLRDRKRPDLIAFAGKSDFVDRIAALQPFKGSEIADRHPLTVLASHTNWAKHRAPSVAATHVGQVNASDRRPRPDLLVPPPSVEPLRGGEVLASAPVYPAVQLDVWATPTIQRPHSGTWHIVMYELAFVETWVRETAIPTLIAGTTDVQKIRPGIDITLGYQELRKALDGADIRTAFDRNVSAMRAEGSARPGLIQLLAIRADSSERQVIEWWVDQLDDESANGRFERLAAAASDPRSISLALAQVRAIALNAYRNR